MIEYGTKLLKLDTELMETRKEIQQDHTQLQLSKLSIQ
jgi:hypothetical protein